MLRRLRQTALDRAFVTSGPDAPPATLDLLMSVLEHAELALVVAGQMSAAVVMDHFGAFGLSTQPVSVSRLLGVALVIGGVVLIKD